MSLFFQIAGFLMLCALCFFAGLFIGALAVYRHHEKQERIRIELERQMRERRQEVKI